MVEAATQETERVLDWRTARLEELGIPEQDAFLLAALCDVDWHEAERLIVQGCPPGLVIRILA